MNSPKCTLCRKPYSPDCDYNQGQCPHHAVSSIVTPLTKRKKTKQPDPRKHLYISLVKSAVGIAAGVSLVMIGLTAAGAFFIAAEILGIAKELL
jgi:hypothetical protein